ncbi:uracil-DNA glycosylase [Chloroflexota bacterium]
MRVSECVGCENFPCVDVKHDRYILPEIEVNPEKVALILISEAAPDNRDDYYYAGDQPLFEQTTVHAFNQAGVEVSSLQALLDMGIYFTTAVKCGKTGYGLKAATIKKCSNILEGELNLFPNVQAYLLMGDVAIKAINYIAKRETTDRAIPAGSTYKIRGRVYYFRGKRAYPSYLQVGPSFGIEKSKQRMIAEDITAALAVLDN